MSEQAARLFGPPAYQPRTGWPAGAAVGAGVAIFGIAAGLATMLVGASQIGADTAPAPHTSAGDVFTNMVWLNAMQAVIVVLTVLAAGFFGSRRLDALALRAPAQGYGVIPKALAVMTLGIACYAVLVAILSPQDFIRDMQPFQRMIRSDARLLVLTAVGIGAPLSEEILFRGFLFSAIAKTNAGPLGASFATTAVWAALHGGYSTFGVIQVALIGLFFCWLLLRTGSLLVPLLCHAIYNTTVVLVLAFLPLPAG